MKLSESDVQRFAEHAEGLRKALEIGGNTHGLDDVLDAIADGEAQLWTAPGAVIVSEINEFPYCKELCFWLATGDLDAVVKLSHEVMDWGREQGCSQAALIGRKGWVKALAEEGWTQSSVMMGRKL